MYESIRYSRAVIMRLIDIIIGAVELLLGLRVCLRLLGASPASEFVLWLYTTTDQLLAPFSGMFPTWVVSDQQTQYVVEFSTLFAMLVFAFLGWLLVKAVALITDSVLRIDHTQP